MDNQVSSNQQSPKDQEQRLDTAFFYGTLMHPSVLTRVILNDGAHLKITPGILKGYTRHHVIGADYPAIIPSSMSHKTFKRTPNEDEDTVRGVIVQGLTPHDMRRLDFFEGGLYDCIKLMAQPFSDFQPLKDVQPEELIKQASPSNNDQLEAIPVLCYVWGLPVYDLEPSIWDYEAFVRDKLARWM
ncbi:hypothetical protein FRC02_004688 [Tulasnella sp. 418]|nr:hypothetical protein FRC02_004688 [Tulasnella sp. 418]